uniref:RNI-like superfamily protein n=1 Tax=Kalanchoe fedtschenkoi TaxID=63787 RepID=A0A7N0VA50_KALFE
MALVAIARRKKLLTDDVLLALIDSSWEILDLCGSDVSDAGLTKVAEICKFLRAVDISGCMRSDNTIRGCLGILKPQLSPMEEDTWEEIDMEITHVAQSLRWLVWPTIDHDSLDSLSKECPRITVNPKPSSSFCKEICFPKQVLPDVALDEFVVEDVDPRTWLICGYVPKAEPCTTSDRNELSVAEKFRLAFAERDARLAPKRAKNARQRLRRSAKEWDEGYRCQGHHSRLTP